MNTSELTRTALSVSEAALVANVSERNIRRGVDKGEVPSFRIGDRILIPSDFIEIMMKQQLRD